MKVPGSLSACPSSSAASVISIVLGCRHHARMATSWSSSKGSSWGACAKCICCNKENSTSEGAHGTASQRARVACTAYHAARSFLREHLNPLAEYHIVLPVQGVQDKPRKQHYNVDPMKGVFLAPCLDELQQARTCGN
eukprot:1147180-Pelagomonas_calceolata.AAC.3